MSELLERVAEFSRKAHEGQFDKGGHPYYLHPQCVANMEKTEDEKIVGYLHDVVEDTKYTIDDIKALGVNDLCIEAIKYLTHDKSIPYDDYVAKIKQCELARKVKINDLKNNSDLSRLNKITAEDLKRVEKYKKALQFLQN